MSRELVSPEVGKTLVVRLPINIGAYELDQPTATVRVVKRIFNFAGTGPSGFYATLTQKHVHLPRGYRLYFLDRDIAYVPANFVKEG